MEERFLVKGLRGLINMAAPKQVLLRAIHLRFYTALALNDLINEVSFGDVCHKYGCNKGFLQALQQSAATFAGQFNVRRFIFVF